jgi:viroplasmin and RNaseH domain-containing protein
MKKKFYAVAKGRKIGIFETWEECQKYVKIFLILGNRLQWKYI